MPSRHFFWPMLGIVVVWTLLVQVGAIQRGGQATFSAGAVLVPVDVRVIDRNGRSVKDLKEQDFTILEDGIPQRIAHFAVHEASSGGAPSQAPLVTADPFESNPTQQRAFLIVLGRGRLQGPADGVSAILQLVRTRLRPDDFVAVTAWNRSTPLTRNHDEISALLERFRTAHEGIEVQIALLSRVLVRTYVRDVPIHIQRMIDDVFGSSRMTEGSGLATSRPQMRQGEESLARLLDDNADIGSDLKRLYVGVEYLRQLSGQKHLIFLSEYGAESRSIDDDRTLGRLAADARVAIHIVHAGGVPFPSRDGGALTRSPSIVINAMTARTLSSLSGGLFFASQFKKAATDLELIEEAASFEYLLGYYPTARSWDGKFRKITVTASRRDTTVLYRSGYFAKTGARTLEPRDLMVLTRIATAAQAASPITDLRVAAEAVSRERKDGVGLFRIDVTLDLTRVVFKTNNGANVASVNLVALAVDGKGETLGREAQTLELTLTDARLREARNSGYRYSLRIPYDAETRTLKIVAYDYAADLLGTTTVRVK